MLNKEEIKKEIKEEILNEIKAMFQQKEIIEKDEENDISIEEYIEDEIEFSTDLELWVSNLKEIFEIMDQTETLSLDTLNEKFENLADICAAIVVQLRIIKQQQLDLEEQLKGTKGYGILGKFAESFLNQKEDQPKNSTDSAMYM